MRIFNSDPPAPDVVPDIRPSDPTLTPGQKVAIVIALTNRGNRVARRLRACLNLAEQLRLSGRRCREFALLRPGQTVAYRVLAEVAANACRGRLTHRLDLRHLGLSGSRRDRELARVLAGRCAAAPCPTVARAAVGRGGAQDATAARPVRHREVIARAAC